MVYNIDVIRFVLNYGSTYAEYPYGVTFIKERNYYKLYIHGDLIAYVNIVGWGVSHHNIFDQIPKGNLYMSVQCHFVNMEERRILDYTVNYMHGEDIYMFQFTEDQSYIEYVRFLYKVPNSRPLPLDIHVMSVPLVLDTSRPNILDAKMTTTNSSDLLSMDSNGNYLTNTSMYGISTRGKNYVGSRNLLVWDSNNLSFWLKMRPVRIKQGDQHYHIWTHSVHMEGRDYYISFDDAILINDETTGTHTCLVQDRTWETVYPAYVAINNAKIPYLFVKRLPWNTIVIADLVSFASIQDVGGSAVLNSYVYNLIMANDVTITLTLAYDEVLITAGGSTAHINIDVDSNGSLLISDKQFQYIIKHWYLKPNIRIANRAETNYRIMQLNTSSWSVEM